MLVFLEEVEDKNAETGTEPNQYFVFSEFEFLILDPGTKNSDQNDTE